MMSKEIWKDIPEYEGLYQASNFGNIKRIKFINNKIKKQENKILKIYVNKFKRCYVCLYKNGKRKNCTVHRLVANAFIDNFNNYPEINHIDGNPLNNNIENLEWCTSSENMKHAYKNNLNPIKMINDRRKKKIIRNDNKIYSCAYEAAKDLKVSVCSIRDVLKNRTKTCKGYSFKYCEANNE